MQGQKPPGAALAMAMAQLRRFFSAVTVLLIGASSGGAAILRDDAVFTAGPAAYAEPLASRTRGGETEPLRLLSVEERVGVAREKALVRVPVFFCAGECRDPDELAVVPEEAPGGPPLAVQLDDVRRGPDGGVSRLHVWFETDIGAWAKRCFLLVRRTGAKGRDEPAPVKVTVDDAGLTIESRRTRAQWNAHGGLTRIETDGERWDWAEPGARPDVRVRYHDKRGGVDFSGATKADVRWATGPLFAKVVVVHEGADGARLEQVWRVPRDGRELVLTSAVFLGPRPGGKVVENRVLAGKPQGAVQLVDVPSGVRPDLRAVHLYPVNAWTRDGAALLAEPLVLGGSNGRWQLAKDGTLLLHGFRGVERGKSEQETLHAFWTEMRLVPVSGADIDTLWRAHLATVQPLVAVVDDPAATRDQLHEALQAVVRPMKPVNWAQEAARFQVLDAPAKRDAVWRSRPNAKETDVAALVHSGENAWAKLSEHGRRKLREDEKSRASGLLDPYHITYTLGAAAALAALPDASPKVDAALRATAEAAREFLGRADENGFPYVDCFSRTLNMQTGPVLFGLAAKGEDGEARERRAFYRDVATAPVVLGIVGRGQRPYVATRREKPDYSDYLYQAISDFWLRTAELLGHEDLQLHPLTFARYTDCIDVLADRYHALDSRDRDGSAGPVRANFFRGQGHTHRWLGWSCAPFVRLLEEPREARATGLTEAIYYARSREGRWNNWPDLTFYALTDLLMHALRVEARKPALPPRPTALRAQVGSQGVELSWAPVRDAVRYRVMRAPADTDDWVWLNSPYAREKTAQIVNADTRFVDPQGRAGERYIVFAEDIAGRASAWPLDRAGAVVAAP